MCPARSARFRAMRIAALLLAVCGAPAAAAAMAAPTAAHPYAAHVTEASQRFGIPEQWIWRVMHVESRGKQRAVSHAGAMGLMQIMPRTWAMLSARHGLGTDPFEPRANILGGAAYLRAMWDRYGDIKLMLAAYNAGPGRVDAYAAGRRGLPAETIAYVASIAPYLGASGVASLAVAPTTDRFTWRSAPLFTGRAADRPAAALLQAERKSVAPPLLSERKSSALFVPLSGSAQ